jgi:hypothetical protein
MSEGFSFLHLYQQACSLQLLPLPGMADYN